ncbi:MAG: phage tail tube protein [Marinobacter sp.]|uniref:phage tail tube protein n=1 Tax=Marinobacter sp. TaxID=50741 RepID=UPI003C66797A
MASSSRVRIAYREAGASTPWIIIRRTNDALTVGTETQRSDEIRSDRTRGDQKVTTITAAGTIDFEFNASNLDVFIAAALGGTWTADTPVVGTDQLKNGVTVPKFEFLKSYLDTDDHVKIGDAVVGEMQLTANAGEKVTGQISIMGSSHDDDYDPTGDTFDEPSDTVIMDSSNNLGTILIDGSAASGICFTGISFTISGGFQMSQCVGNQYQDHFAGSIDITGTLTTRLSAEGLALWRKSITSTPVSFGFTLSEGDDSYDISLPRNFLSGDLPSGGLDAILTSDLTLTSARDANGVMMQVERTLAV